MLSAIEADTAPAIGGENGRLTLELITAIYKAGFMKQDVTLPLKQDDPFYTVAGVRALAPHFYEKNVSRMELGDSDISLDSFDKKGSV